MPTFDRDIDKIAMDIISGSMYSLNFLRNISVAIFDKRIKDMTVREFYEAWLKKTKYTEHSVPYCLGSIFGYLYCGILLSKERWYDLLPEDYIKDASAEWGLVGVKYNSPKKLKPSIKYTIRRMRNALGHGNISINVPHDLDHRKDEFEFEKKPLLSSMTKTKEIVLMFLRLRYLLRGYQCWLRSFMELRIEKL